MGIIFFPFRELGTVANYKASHGIWDWWKGVRQWRTLFLYNLTKNFLLTNWPRCAIIDRPTLGALAGIRVMSSDINFFIQNAQNVCSAYISHNVNICPAATGRTGRFFRKKLPIWNFSATSSGLICALKIPKSKLICAALSNKIKKNFVNLTK
jgi:hypothetical protein